MDSTEEHLLSWDPFAWHRLAFNCKRPVIRGHLPNADSGQANHKMVRPLPGMRRQFASCKYPLKINFNSPSADFIVLLQNLPCSSAWMVEVEQVATYEHYSVFKHQRAFTHKQLWLLNLPIIFSICSAFLIDCYHFMQKNDIQKIKTYIRAEGSSHESTGEWLLMKEFTVAYMYLLQIFIACK